MNSLLAQILIITGVFSFVLFISTFPFVDDEDKSPSLFIWLFSIGIYAFSTIFLGSFYFLYPTEFGLDSFLVRLGFLALVNGYTGAIIFFRYLSRVTSWKKVAFIFACIFVINITIIYGLLKLPIDLRIIGPSLWSIGLSLWLFYELSSKTIHKKDYLIYILKITILMTIIPSFIWLGFLINYHLEMMHSLTWDEVLYFDNFVRVVRNITAPFAFLLLFIYWVKYHSTFAKETENSRLRVDLLLKEKDKLILELSNINSLVSTGALAAGLSHELNQYLARIQLNAEDALSKIDDSKLVQSGLQRILKANDEAASLIISLKRLLQGGNRHDEILSIQGIISSICEIYKVRLLKSKITLYAHLDSEDHQITWGALLSQVISNLIANAIDALDTTDIQKKMIHIYLKLTDESLQIKVFDNGPTIDPKAAKDLFTIFSTTKKEGSGIGLWLSKFIVQRHGGDLVFENMPEGVTFTINLPLHK